MYTNLQKIHFIKNSFHSIIPLQKSKFTIFLNLILIRKKGDEYVDRLVAKERKETEKEEERGAMIAA